MPSDQQMSWLDRIWFIDSVDSANGFFKLDLSTSDIVIFDSKNNTIAHQPGTLQTLNRLPIDPSRSQPWGRWTQVLGNELSGVTRGGDYSFTVSYDGGHRLTCSVTSNPSLRRTLGSLRSELLLPFALGSSLGTLVGAAVGAAFGSPGAGLLAGATAAIVSSAATLVFHGYGHAATHSTGTWVANDGGAAVAAGTLKDPRSGPAGNDTQTAKIA